MCLQPRVGEKIEQSHEARGKKSYTLLNKV